jgi:HJR/Mrr/RecB family endonuclease
MLRRTFQLLDIGADRMKFTTKDKKIIEYFLSQITDNVNITLLNDTISKKKECLSSTVNQDDFNDIEFVTELYNSF